MGDAEKSSWPQGQDLALRAAVVGAALLAGGIVFWLRFCGDVEMPARPAALTPVGIDEGLAGDDLFARQLAADARSLRLQRIPGVAEMAGALPHQVDDSRHRLQLGGSLEAAGLRIAVVEVDGMLSLRVENLRPAPVAYRIDARPDRGRACLGGRRPAHNALALRAQGDPGAVAVRGICPHKRDAGLTLTRVETVDLPLLGYHYVARMRPSLLGLDEELVAGHRHEGLPACDTAVPAWLVEDLEVGRTSWRDLIDFYARHPCDKYQYPQGYKAIDQGSRPLP